MFYVKFAAWTGVKIVQLTEKNVYTKCPECGKDHIVNLEELIKEGKGFNLRTTRVLCPKCSKDNENNENKELMELFRKKTRNQKRAAQERKKRYERK